MSEHRAHVRWQNDGAPFTYDTFSRDHARIGVEFAGKAVGRRIPVFVPAQEMAQLGKILLNAVQQLAEIEIARGIGGAVRPEFGQADRLFDPGVAVEASDTRRIDVIGVGIEPDEVGKGQPDE